jgi:hypothetical protein
MTVVPHAPDQIAQIGAWREELEALHARLAPRFQRPEVRARAGKVLAGLLEPVERRFRWHWSAWRRTHQARARRSHYRRRVALQPARSPPVNSTR